ncbi:unnamed protein product [Cuscuta epithymum]|uniref:BHLH domain-containing protein n=1 Tax=Cuscuta epithymum TaxID=186058 RepID=A0AAV0F2U7_9ASTE|nr:unnamed protein product [Cuscuta epithymum]
MKNQENYTASLPPTFDYSLDHMNNKSTGNTFVGQPSSSCCDQVNPMVNPHLTPTGFFSGGSTSFDKLNFADVMQFADFGPKLTLNETGATEDESGLDPVYFLKFPVLNETVQEDKDRSEGIIILSDGEKDCAAAAAQQSFRGDNLENYEVLPHAVAAGSLEGTSANNNITNNKNKNIKGKRKRVRIKSSQEVESQRMTHIAVERNRRKQMNEHLRVLRSLMPSSYVQRGDQASIIGGAIDFVRELEQLLECLESQKRRRLYGDTGSAPLIGDSSTSSQPPLFPLPANEYGVAGICEDTAGSKSCLADVEVKLLGSDGIIKILCRRRPGQLIKVIAALEDLHLNILLTNITTIEQTVLYSFNVKISNDETMYTAEDLANSVQQIFSFINANSI